MNEPSEDLDMSAYPRSPNSLCKALSVYTKIHSVFRPTAKTLIRLRGTCNLVGLKCYED